MGTAGAQDERRSLQRRRVGQECRWVRIFCNGEKLIDSAKWIAMALSAPTWALRWPAAYQGLLGLRANDRRVELGFARFSDFCTF
jgi:hypothetical protein